MLFYLTLKVLPVKDVAFHLTHALSVMASFLLVRCLYGLFMIALAAS